MLIVADGVALQLDPRARRAAAADHRVLPRPRRRPWVFLALVNVLLLALGCFMEPLPIMVIVVPTLLPVVKALGIDLVHFGLVVTLNLMIGLITPPVGLVMFVVMHLTKLSSRLHARGLAVPRRADRGAARHLRARPGPVLAATVLRPMSLAHPCARRHRRRERTGVEDDLRHRRHAGEFRIAMRVSGGTGSSGQALAPRIEPGRHAATAVLPELSQG